MSDKTGIHLLGMRVQNFCRIALAQMAPNGESLTISGKNRQGKTSSCNALWVALGGAAAMKELEITKPVKAGEESAKIYVDMGDILVFREIDPDGSTKKLMVTNKEGIKQEPGQTVLDTFRGKFFDLSQFFRMEAKRRLELILSLTDLGLDLKQWAAARKQVFEERTLVNRELASLEAQLKASPIVEAPDEEISLQDITTEMQQAQLILDDNNEMRQQLQGKAQERARCKERIADTDTGIADIKSRIKGLQEQLVIEEAKVATLNNELEGIQKEGKRIQEIVNTLQDPDMSGYTQRINDVDAINIRVRAKQAREVLKAKVDAKEEETAKLSLKLEAFDLKKSNAIKAAKFPVDGLGFDDDDITYNDMPFSQSSDMERLIVGYGMAKAVSPRFKVLRLSRPGDLDTENKAMLLAMAEADDMQLLIEQVSDGADGDLVIEDGMLDGGTTEGVEKIVEISKPKRAAKGEGAAGKKAAGKISDADMEALCDETMAASTPVVKGAAKETKAMPVAAPEEL